VIDLATQHYARLASGRLGLRRFRDAAPGAPRLLCFPYAGGQSLAFRPLARQLPPDWGVWAIDSPGHGWCAGPALDTIGQMSAMYLEHLPPELVKGAVLFGHSLGGCVAYALTERLLEKGHTPPALVLSAARPPHRAAEYDSFLEMDDQQLLHTLIQIGGVPAEWAQEPDVFDHFKEALRADFHAFESFEPSSTLDGVPVLVFGGLADVVCRPEHVLEWSWFCPRCRTEFVPGAHMFLQTNPEAIASHLVTYLAELGPIDGKRQR